ncbi:hypothetical protein [Peribacillus sp. SCS-37]|uniref:hypothetical protein n=1 Tax=Paraperibacillus esterisolvens TaxID=3115296 RepID=UPI003905E274
MESITSREVSSLKNMSILLIALVKVNHVPGIQPAHDGPRRIADRFGEQMDMMVHQAERMQENSFFSRVSSSIIR